MAAPGQQSSYEATLPNKRVTTDRIVLMDPMAIVAINVLGLKNESKFSFVNTPGTSYDWLLDTYAPSTDVLNTSLLTSDSTLTSITVTNGGYFQPGDVILIDNEYMWVSGVVTTVLTVTRAYGGTQATHSTAAAISIVGRNRLEGAAPDPSWFTSPTTGTNFTAILQKTIEVSRSDNRLMKYGIGDVVSREVDKAMDEVTLHLNRMAYHGQRKVGSATTPRSFGGMKTFIATNLTALAGAPLTEKSIQDQIQNAWAFGGNPSLILTSAWAKRKIADMYRDFVRTTIDEERGGVTISKIESPLGLNLDVVVDRHCQADHLYLLDRNYVGYLTFDDFFLDPLGKTKDTAFFGQVVGEYGFALAFEKAHAIVSGFSTTS